MNNNINSPTLIGSNEESLREAFGKKLVDLGKKNSNFVVFDADVAGGTGTHHFKNSFPNRFYQFGIAEQNMMAAASGFASTGLIPFVTTFAVFCLRAVEQVRLSIAYAKSNVKIVASHPGLDVGPDGASAQCLEDLAIFRSIPGMTVIVPADPLEVSLATEAILNFDGPVYMRTGRSPAPKFLNLDFNFEIGKGKILKTGKDVTIVACGVEVARALDAADILKKKGINAMVVNMSTIKPIDKQLLLECAEQTGCFVTAEDHNIIGGLGGAVSECLAQHKPCPIEFVGVNDVFGESGEPDELAYKFGLTKEFIAEAALRSIKRKNKNDFE
jgi:transketolase